jgi:hypothetical protein
MVDFKKTPMTKEHAEYIRSFGEMMDKLTLGQVVSFSEIYRRCSRSQPSKFLHQRTTMFKYWKNFPINTQTGIVVGLRTLSNGEVHFDSEYGQYYVRRESVLAALVSTSLRNEIVKIPIKNITMIPNSGQQKRLEGK